jgi:hypothetical protein
MSFDEKKPMLRTDILRMNKDITSRKKWGRKEIESRGLTLALAAAKLWPGPAVQPSPDEPQWDLMIASLAQLPLGRWTAYADLAELAATSESEVRDHFLTSGKLPARSEAVLLNDGRIDADRADVSSNVASYRQLLVSQATQAQRFLPQDFAQLLGEG